MRKDTIGKQTPASIRAVIARIAALTDGVDAIANYMEANAIPDLDVKCHAALKRALDDLVRWHGAAQDAINEKMSQMGTFGEDQSPHPMASNPPKKKATKKKSPPEE